MRVTTAVRCEAAIENDEVINDNRRDVRQGDRVGQAKVPAPLTPTVRHPASITSVPGTVWTDRSFLSTNIHSRPLFMVLARSISAAGKFPLC